MALPQSRFESPLSEPLVDSPATTIGSDFNGDGIPDLIMGAKSNSDAASGAGAAYILYGSSGLSSDYALAGLGVNVTLLGNVASDNFGAAVSSAGDINSDGFDDIMGGAPLDDTQAASAGLVHIVYGSPNLSATLRMASTDGDITIIGKASNDKLGQYLTSEGGDINGDGFDDVVMGARYNDDANIGQGTSGDFGAAYILYGGASLSQTYNLLGTGVDVTILGWKSADRFGRSPSSAGDMNADHFDDIIIGAHFNDEVASNAGAAYILYGGSSLATTIQLTATGASVTILGKVTVDVLGTTLSGLGDINGDGFSDIIVGAIRNDDTGTDAGATYIFYGRASRVEGTTLRTGSGEEDISILGKTGDNLGGFLVGGSGVGVIGDINDDGLHDILIGAPYNDDADTATLTSAGAAFLFYGSTSLPSQMNAGSADVTILGKGNTDVLNTVTGTGDLNNDGIPDFAVGAPYNNDGPGANNAGAVYVIFGSKSLSSTFELRGTGANITILGKAASDTLGLTIGGGHGAAGP